MHPEGRTKAFPERRGERVPDRGVGGRFLSEQGLGGGRRGGSSPPLGQCPSEDRIAWVEYAACSSLRRGPCSWREVFCGY